MYTRQRSTSHLRVAACAAVASLFSSLVADDASACSPVPTGWLVSTPQAGPANGVIPISFGCSSDCGSRPDVELTLLDAAGEPVSGSFIESEFIDEQAVLLWKPDAPLAEGEVYRLTITDPAGEIQGPTNDEFTAVGEGPDTVPEAPLEKLVAYATVTPQGDEVCCEETPTDTCGNDRCFIWPATGDVNIELFLPWFDSAELNGQFAISGEFTTPGARYELKPGLDQELRGKLPPAGAGEEYCYEFTARHLVTGKVTKLEGCLAADRVELPDVDVEVRKAMESGLRVCYQPPEGLEDEWCEVINAGDEERGCAGVPEEACDNARAQCGASERADGEVPSVDGCAVTRAEVSTQRRSTAWPWTLMLTAVLGGMAQRRRKGNERAQASRE